MDALTITNQYVGKGVITTTPVNLHRPYKCHNDHDEIKDRNTAPGHGKTFGNVISTGANG